MKLFLRKYLKAPIALLVCLVMVLQLLPAPQPAQAGFWDIIKKIVKGIPLPPEIVFTNEAKIKIGNGKFIPDIPTPWSESVGGLPALGNPFNKISLGGGGLPLIDAETGQPAGYCWQAISCYTNQGQIKRVTAGALSNTESYLDNVYALQLPEAVKNDVLTSPAKVKQALKDALGFVDGLDAYKLEQLRDGDKWRRVWAQYWLDLGRNKLGDTDPSVRNLATEMMLWPENQDASLIKLREGNDVSAVQIAILAKADYSYLKPLMELDDEKGFGSQNKSAGIDNYAQDSKNECCYIGRPIIPEECELGIRYPGDDVCAASCDEKRAPILREDCREKCNQEKLAHREACTHYIRLQKAAADIAFLAKKIYNSTNPLDDCFFLKNCKSKCLLSYGEVKYVITWLDIAQFLLPTAWITVIKQIMGVIAALGQIKQAYDALSSLLTDGLTLISGFFDTFHYLTTMFTALQNIGGTMSASIGVASVAASALDATGILSIPGNAAQFGAVAGAATVLAADSKGVNAMQGMLKRFSDNLLNYSTAKSETNKLLLGMRQNLLDVMEGNDETKGAKHEIELAFFFEPNNPVRKNLDNMVGNFQTNFKSLASLLDSTIGPGQLPDGSGVDKLTSGSWQEFQKNNAEPVLDSKAWEDGNGGVYLKDTAFGDKNIKNKDNFCKNDYEGNDKRICMFNGDRVIPWQSVVTCPDNNPNIVYGNLIPKLAKPNDYQIIIDRTKPEYIKDMLDAALGVGTKDNYLMKTLKDKEPWRSFWQELDKIITGANYSLDELKDSAKLDKLELDVISKEGFSFLSPISALDNKDNDGHYKDDGKRNATQALVNDYASARENSGLFPVICDSSKVGAGVTWLDNFKDIFAESSGLQATLKLVDPIYIRDMLIGESSVMECAHKAGRCKLNFETKGWREYWEKMANGLAGEEWVNGIINDEDKKMFEKHQDIVAMCIEKNPILARLVALDSDYSWPTSVEFRDRGYYNAIDNPIEDILDKGDLGVIQTAILNKTDILGDTKPFAFLAPIAALDDKGSYGAYDLPLIRQAVFAEIDKYSAQRTASGLFPAAATPVYTTLMANLDGDPDHSQYLKVVERTEPAYLKNVLDAALGCGCVFDSNAENTSQEIFCDKDNYDRIACARDDSFKYAVLDDSKTAWHYLWTRLGRIILQAETQTNCSGSRNDMGTKAFIHCQIVDYEKALDANRDAAISNALAVTVGGKISAILNSITAFTYQKNYLESLDRHAASVGDKEQRARHFTDAVVASWPLAQQQALKEKGEEGSDYWQSQLWCAGGCKVTALPADQLQELQALEALANPENVKTVLKAALGKNTDNPTTAYGMKELDSNKSAWFNFWRSLAKIVLGSSFTEFDIYTMDKEEYITGLQVKVNNVDRGDSFTRDLSLLDDENGHGWQNKNSWPGKIAGVIDNYATPGARTNTEKYITDVYRPKWDLYYSQASTETTGTAFNKFKESYDPDIAKYDWDARANKLVNSVKDLKTIVFGLNNGLSPQDPAIIASIEKDAKEFADAIEKGKLAITEFQKLRQRDCNRWSYFFSQEHSFKQYGDSPNNYCADCPCSSRACLEWTSTPAPNDFNWCAISPSLPSCEGQICYCCSKRSTCANQRADLENLVHPKCNVYIPDCVWAEQNEKDMKKLRDDCLADPCKNEKTARDACLANPNPCQNAINQYQWAKDNHANCAERRAAYTPAEISGADAANQAASAESNALWGFFGRWWNFGGTTDTAKIADYYYYKNRDTYKTLRQIEDLILALQIVWQDDLTTVEAQERLGRALDIFISEECGNNAWVYDPSPRCSSKMIKVNRKLNEILAVWQGVRHSAMDSASGSAARPAKDYTASIISSKIIAREISYRIQSLKSYFEESPGYPMNSPEVMEQKIAKDLAYLPADQKAMLMDIITEFKAPYNTMKAEVIDALDKSIGQYVYANNPGLSNICPANINELGFLNRLSCFEYCGGLPLDQCLKPEAVIKSHTFDELMQPLSAIENIEDAIFLLTDAKLDINKISSVQESVDNLRPEIQPQNVVSINTNLVNDFNAKLSGKIKDVLNKYNPLKTGGVETNPAADKKLQLFTDSKGESATSTFKDFANSLADNPLSFLEDQFANIKDQFQTIKKRLENTGGLLRNFYSGERGNLYNSMTDKARALKMDELNLKINGNQSLVGACSALGLILQGDITEMNRVCTQKEDGGELLSQQLRQWEAVNAQGESKQKTCDIWLALADDITDVATIDREIADLREHRNCIGDNCIQCPAWFCANPPNGAWGAGAMQNDQYCVDKCANGEGSQGDGYVCKNNIIWSTSQQPSQVPATDSVKPAVCQQAGLSVSCKVSDLSATCSAFTNKVKIEKFDEYTSNQIDNTQQIQQLQDDLTCVAYENCAYGYDKNFFSAQIKTTVVGGKEKPCIACPKWICVNPNNAELPYGNDSYCNEKIAETGLVGSNVNGLSWNFNNSNKIWDSTWPVGLRKWLRDTACFSSDGKTRPTNVLADKYSRQLGGSAANYTWINNACIVKQKELKALLDQSPAVIINFPWDTENWPCKTKANCQQMASACQALKDGNATPLAAGWSAWPPTKPPLTGGYTQGYQGAQIECIRTQAVMTALEKVKAEIEKATANEPQFAAEVLTQLNADCNELKRQQELKKECDSYALAKKAVANTCGSDSACRDKRDKMNGLCSLASGQNWSSKETYCVKNSNQLKNLLLDTDEAKAGLQKVRDRCMQTLDIRTPLGEIMRVLSILMGIQSGTAAHSGIISSIQGARVFYENVGKFILMIENLHNAMDTAYDDTMAKSADRFGGAKTTYFKCVAMPAESVVRGQKMTGPNGGPVCPKVGNIYSQIQADFATIRQEAKSVTQAMYKTQGVDVPLPWGEDAYLHLFDKYEKAYLSIKPLSDRAQELRGSAQFVWAMATAINFANANCTCGMSYCKLPFCISGLPLTLAPLKDPYCALVWMLRTPMIDLSNRLAEDLNKTLDKVK